MSQGSYVKRVSIQERSARPDRHSQKTIEVENGNGYECALDFSKLSSNKKSDSVFIVAGGHSLHNFDFSKLSNVDTIAVNASAAYIKCPTYFVTMDYTFYTKEIVDMAALTKSGTGTAFIVNMTSTVNKKTGLYVDSRSRITYKNLCNFKYILESNSLVNDVTGFSKKMPDFSHGANSGFCAIQLAILLQYRKIYLLGFDMHVIEGKTHFHDKYSSTGGSYSTDKKIDFYRENLKKAIKLYDGPSQIISCNLDSSLNDVLDYVDIDCALGIINE